MQQLTKPDTSEQQVKEIQEGLAAAKLSTTELGKLQDRQRAAIERSVGRAGGRSFSPGSGETSPISPIHPDLQDLQFGPLGVEQRCVFCFPLTSGQLTARRLDIVEVCRRR